MKKTYLFEINLVFTLAIIIFLNCQYAKGQNECNNYWNSVNNIGIHTNGASGSEALHIKGWDVQGASCKDPAIFLEYYSQNPPTYGGYLALKTNMNESYSNIANAQDLLLVANSAANNLILATRNDDGKIIFSTTHPNETVDQAAVTIINLGNVGIFNSNPKDALQIGYKMNFHTGSSDYFGYNDYVNASSQRVRITGGNTQSINFSSDILSIAVAESLAVDSQISYTETSGGFKGITIRSFGSNPDYFASVGIGSTPFSTDRLYVRGFGNNSSSYAFRVANKDTISIFCVKDDENSGFGITTPGSKVVIKGKDHSDDYSSLNVTNDQDGSLLFVRNDGNVGIGDDIPDASLKIHSSGSTDQTYALKIENNAQTPLQLLTVRDDGLVTFGGDLEIDGKLKLGPRRVQGPDDPSAYYDTYFLSVDGTILTSEVVVTDKAEDWMPDYVFNENYPLMPLDEVEKNIKKNHHLPGIPSAKEVAKHGIKIGEMQSALLQKIEELTLYTIELKKEIDQLKGQKESMR
jgi:hypothetical protein